MIRECAWCGKKIGEKPPLEDKSVTHGICPECIQKQANKIEASFTINAYRSISK